MKKIQEVADLKVNNSSEGSLEDCTSKQYHQGVKPKVKHQICNKGNKSSQLDNGIQNGSASESKKIQNGASCSSSSSSSSCSSSSSSSISKIVNSSCVDDSDEKCSAKGRALSAEDNDLGTHDKKRKTGGFMDNESSSGNEGDEGLSGDDFCIYTYKGDQFADLPNSFFNVDMAAEGVERSVRNNHRDPVPHREAPGEEDRSNPGSSPEMDYLEMDFDPGPSLEQDSEEEMFDRKASSPVPELPAEQMTADNCLEASPNTEKGQEFREPQPGPSKCSPAKQNKLSDCNCNHFNRTKEFLDDCCIGSADESFGSQGGREENVTETEANDVNSFNCQLFPPKRLDKQILLTENSDLCISMSTECEVDSKMPFDGIMLWTEQEAISKQVTLVSPEVSCSATAVINAMLVLKMRFSIEKVKEGISTRLRSESASIPQYLVSRSFAGVAHENLIRGIYHASHGTLYARFFQMYPRRDIVLSRWLSHWMKKGAVPIATMNVQREAAQEKPAADTRHHQMIFGVSSKGIYLTNPLECLQDEELWRRLVSPSVLKIKRSEIVSRWSPETNLRPLMFQSDDRWKKMNVLGQVVNIIRESPDPGVQGKFLTQHISIPASSGITLVIARDSSGYEDLVSTPDLPLSPSSKSD